MKEFIEKHKPYLWGYIILGLLTLGFILNECLVDGATKLWGIALIIFIARLLPTILTGARETKAEGKSIVQYFLEVVQILCIIIGGISWLVDGKVTVIMFIGAIALGIVTWLMDPITITWNKK